MSKAELGGMATPLQPFAIATCENVPSTLSLAALLPPFILTYSSSSCNFNFALKLKLQHPPPPAKSMAPQRVPLSAGLQLSIRLES